MSFRQVTLGRICCVIIALAAASVMGRMAFAAESSPLKPAGMTSPSPVARPAGDANQPAKATDTDPAKPEQVMPSRQEGPTSSNGIRLYRYGRASQVYGVH